MPPTGRPSAARLRVEIHGGCKRPVKFRDFADFEQRMLRPTFVDRSIDDETLEAIRIAFEPHCGPEGAHFTRPMHVRLLRRLG